MEVTIDKEKHMVTVRKEKRDPIFHRTDWGLAESTFLHHVKLELIKQGYDCIKNRMWKDDHLVETGRKQAVFGI